MRIIKFMHVFYRMDLFIGVDNMKIQEQCKEIRKLRQQIRSIQQEIKRDKEKYKNVLQALEFNKATYTKDAVLAQENGRNYCYKQIYSLRQILCCYPFYLKVLSYVI